MHASSVSHPHRLSATPPLPQTLSKRDKRRNAISERLNELVTTFAENRDPIYRQQLQALQVDMGYMLRADPYQDKPLDDLADDITEEMVAAMASHPGSFVRGSQGAARMPMPEVELPPASGKWASVFAQEINNALEQRDASLTLLAVRFSSSLGIQFNPNLWSCAPHHKAPIRYCPNPKLMDRVHRNVTHEECSPYIKINCTESK